MLQMVVNMTSNNGPLTMMSSGINWVRCFIYVLAHQL